MSQTITIIGGLDADLIMIGDRFPKDGESRMASEYLEALGGKGANTAIATHRSCHQKPLDAERWTANSVTANEGAPIVTHPAVDSPRKGNIQVKMIGAVGDDRYGEMFRIELNRNGIDVSGIVTVPNTRSSVCFVMIKASTRENRCFFTLGATATWKREDFVTPEQLGGGMIPDLVVAQMEIDKEIVETMIETAGKAGIEFCLNAAPANPISKRLYQHLTHLLVNESEAAIMSGRRRKQVNKKTWSVIANEFLNRGVKNVVITLGAKGAFYANATGSKHCPAFDVKVEDTTGAGDTFTGAYASEYLRQKDRGIWDIESAVIRANKAAAITIQTLGAQNGIPWADEVDDFDALHNAPDLKQFMPNCCCM